MQRLPDWARSSVNHDVLLFLERQAKPRDPASADFDLDAFELHTHPDLMERLVEASAGLDAPMVAAFGVPVLVHPNGVLFACAYSMDTLLLRLPEELHARVVASGWIYQIGPAWVPADAWLTGVPRRGGTERMREWCRWAYAHAGLLAGVDA